MGQLTYKMKNYSKAFLQSHKFRHSGFLSNSEEDIYTYKFPVHFWNKTPTVECEISVSATTGNTNINVYNSGTKELYAAYYYCEYGVNNIINQIQERIVKVIKELNIEKVK